MHKTQRSTLNVRAEPASDSRTIRFTASTAGVARDGGIVLSDAWDTSSYEANPVVLFAHRSDDLPVGKATRIERSEEGTLQIDVLFAGEEQKHDRAETLYRLYKGGFCSAVSVGFRVLEERAPTDEERAAGASWVATRTELLELSLVPVPADPSALSSERIEAAHAAGALERKDLLVVRGWAGIACWNDFAKECNRIMSDKIERTVVEAEDYFLQVVRDGATFNEGTFEEVAYPQADANDPLVYMIVGVLQDGRTVIQALKWLKSDGWTVEAATEWALSNEDAILEWEQPAEEDAPAEGEEKPEADAPAEQKSTGRTFSREELDALVGLLRQAAEMLEGEAPEGEEEEKPERDEREVCEECGEEPCECDASANVDETAERFAALGRDMNQLREAIEGLRGAVTKESAGDTPQADESVYDNLLDEIRRSYSQD